MAVRVRTFDERARMPAMYSVVRKLGKNVSRGLTRNTRFLVYGWKKKTLFTAKPSIYAAVQLNEYSANITNFELRHGDLEP